jgi:hypothetical protein
MASLPPAPHSSALEHACARLRSQLARYGLQPSLASTSGRAAALYSDTCHAPVRSAPVCCVAWQLLRTFLVRIYTTSEGEAEIPVRKLAATSASQLLFHKCPMQYRKLVDALHSAVCSQCDPTKKITLWFSTRLLTNERRNVPLSASEDPTQVTKDICALSKSLRTGQLPIELRVP